MNTELCKNQSGMILIEVGKGFPTSICVRLCKKKRLIFRLICFIERNQIYVNRAVCVDRRDYFTCKMVIFHITKKITTKQLPL